MLDRDEARANAVAAEVNGKPWVADVGDEKGLDDCASAIEDAVKPVNVLVNSAGVLQVPASPEQLPMSSWDDVASHRPARHLCGVGRVRAAHGQARTRLHHQHRLGYRHALGAAARLCPGQGGGHCHNRMSRRGMGPLGRAGQRGARRATR